MTNLTYDRMTMGEQTYRARQTALMKSMGVDNMSTCARILAAQRTITINGREIAVVIKRNFKALMVK